MRITDTCVKEGLIEPYLELMVIDFYPKLDYWNLNHNFLDKNLKTADLLVSGFVIYVL